ncbi:hypothetical protein [Neochlamydia sp. AcF95]|uniref:hypothetical protein n=1 Tax=Neochlamydia sp. AcF95 TaxID=2795734 RepID=UPI001BCA6726|nr:hypothetical protein [Neochlamydia sp. AcF95]MBS4170657.1 Uncharacterized protein [Neochlamydia sp. AcF95]
MIRSSYPIFDEVFCAIQGFAGAHLVNVIKGAKILNPTTAAICFAGIALTEKVVYELSKRIIPGPTVFLGPLPLGAKNIVSYSLAIYTTFKIMKLAGLILAIPKGIVVIGAVCSVALVISGTAAIIKTASLIF